MAIEERGRQQRPMWLDTASGAKGPGHPFFGERNRLLKGQGLDQSVESLCRPFFADRLGRPSLPPVAYFLLLLIDYYFEGIDSERGIAWRLGSSLTLREFLGYELSERTPNHSATSRNRRLIPAEVHQEMFAWVVTVLERKGLLRGKALGVDATTLKTDAATRSIVRRDIAGSYHDYSTYLENYYGIEIPTREGLARFDSKRKNGASKKDWQNPHDPDANITKLTDGRTDAHKAELAFDLETGAVMAVTLQPTDRGGTGSISETLSEALENIGVAVGDAEERGKMRVSSLEGAVSNRRYHREGVLRMLDKEKGVRSYLPEPKRGRRTWKDREACYN